MDAKYIVTKDTGDTGGFREKISAAAETGTAVILISRPGEEEGFTLEQLKEYISARLKAAGVEGWVHNTAGFGRYGQDMEVSATPVQSTGDGGSQYGSLARFPLFIDLRDRRVLVAGGGNIATRRVNTLIKFGADILVVAPELSPELRMLWSKGKILVKEDIYRSEYIKDKYLAIAATDSRAVNHQIHLDAEGLGIPVSVADNREECSFYFPAVFELDGVTGGIVSNNGDDHRRVRQVAEKLRS